VALDGDLRVGGVLMFIVAYFCSQQCGCGFGEASLLSYSLLLKKQETRKAQIKGQCEVTFLPRNRSFPETICKIIDNEPELQISVFRPPNRGPFFQQIYSKTIPPKILPQIIHCSLL